MKKINTLLLVVLFAATTFAQVGMGTTTPDASSAIDISATTKGLLMPRMTNAQRQTISNPAAGLQVFVTDFDGGRFMFYDGTEWNTIATGGPKRKTISADTTLDNTDEIIIINGAFTATLPAAPSDGMKLTLCAVNGLARVDGNGKLLHLSQATFSSVTFSDAATNMYTLVYSSTIGAWMGAW